MGKFENRSGSDDKGRSKSRGDKRPARKSSGEEEKKTYKTKRSFTKNKSFRGTDEAKKKDRPSRPFAGSDDRKPARKSFDGERSSGYGEKPKRTYGDRDEKKPFKKEDSSDRPKREGRGEERGSFKKDFGSERKTSYSDRTKREGKEEERGVFKKDFGSARKTGDSERPKRESREREDRPFKKDFGKDEYHSKKSTRSTWDAPQKDSEKTERPERTERAERSERPERAERSSESRERKPRDKAFKPKEGKFDNFKKASEGSNFRGKRVQGEDTGKKKRFSKPRKGDEGEPAKRFKHDEFEDGKGFAPQTSRESAVTKRAKKPAPIAKQTGTDGLIRLNKYLSNAGIASRRDADNLIVSGTVKVNGVVVDQLGAKISPTDKVTYGDSAVRTERKVYLLLNKPKDYITTLDDPKERKTVMELVTGACRERIYPVGRLDRNTTGLLLFTNDGDMTTKLTHPKFGVKKVYHVSLNKGLKPEDFKAITEGVELEDGVVKADDLAFVGEGKKEVGIEIHSGRNRIVRRIFEHLGYDVLKLDRVVFAGLTKKDLPRGKHRFLTGKEISFLQMIG